MTPFTDCSDTVKSLIFVWSILLVLLSTLDLGRIIQHKRLSLPAAAISELICCYTLAQLAIVFLKNHSTAGLLRLAGQAPVSAMIVFAAILTIVGLLLNFYISKLNRTAVTPYSIKESIDTLPEGLCCYLDSGLIKLKNKTMDNLCRELSGKSLLDGKAFWETVSSENTNHIQCGENPIIQLQNGSVFSFRRNKLNLENHILYEITASDITEEYRLNNTLKQKQKKTDEINQRLKNLNSTITDLTIEKETLAAKSQIHDNLGNALLSAKKYLLDKTTIDKKEMLRYWRLNIMLLKNELPEIWRDKYADCFRSAALLGVKIKVSDKLPENTEAYVIVEKAISTCAANTAAHSKGDELIISCKDSDEKLILTFRNNGIPPSEDIKETGGLKKLRRVVERSGGTFEIKVKPEFALTIVLKKKVSQ